MFKWKSPSIVVWPYILSRSIREIGQLNLSRCNCYPIPFSWYICKGKVKKWNESCRSHWVHSRLGERPLLGILKVVSGVWIWWMLKFCGTLVRTHLSCYCGSIFSNSCGNLCCSSYQFIPLISQLLELV